MTSVGVRRIDTTCCIAGGGPAGLMLGYLLARAGVDVVVLEKHADFLRDFRGDTIHPSTLELMYELELLDEFLQLPHAAMARIEVAFNGRPFVGPDFSHLPTHCKFIAFMPQWDFLNFIAGKAAQFANFQLLQRAEVDRLLQDGERISGVHASSPDGSIEVHAALVVGADGRASAVRTLSGLVPEEFGVPIDVLWLKIPKRGQRDAKTLFHIRDGRLLITIDRDDYWQCTFVIAKGAFTLIRAAGLAAFRAQIAATAPATTAGLADITNWDQVFLLTVQINRLPNWYRDGLLCIGDAAHAMSPAAGVGINLAIQDAVAAANLLAARLRRGAVSGDDLKRVQQRRERAVRMTQALQLFIHRRLMAPGRDGRAGVAPPRAARVLLRLLAPLLRRLAARIIGIGFRAEHIGPDLLPPNAAHAIK